MNTSFLPTTALEMKEHNITQCDFIIVSGDAYVDHSSFASALIGRLLESMNFTVGIIAQPDVKNIEEFKSLGRPRFAFLVSGGAMDSMVANYTANKKPRSNDSYSHGGLAGKRADRAIITYTAKLREAFKGVAIIIGGIEASLRRFAHYDYWSDTIKHSILLDSKADLLVYGMGEKPLQEIAIRLLNGEDIKSIRGVRGTCWRTGNYADIESISEKAVFLPIFEEVSKNTEESKKEFAKSFVMQEQNTDPINASILIEKSEERYVVCEPPSIPLTKEEFDFFMELPYKRLAHYKYDKPAENGKSGIPALSEMLFSLTSCRGCFGSCSFCAITFHQGRRIQSRSIESLEREAKELTKHPDFKGYIHDVGGPTANFRIDACSKQSIHGSCKNRLCLGDKPCKNIEPSHEEYIFLLKRLAQIPKVKKVFVRSGIRFDYVLADKKFGNEFLEYITENNVSGQLRTAPEHVCDDVLKLMRKSDNKTYELFRNNFEKINTKLQKKQFIVPYYIASHPGSTLRHAAENALYLQKCGFVPEQIQDFYPTPGSLSTCMYYTGLNPYTGDKVFVARGEKERKLQRALLQFNKTENRALVIEALKKIGDKKFNKLLSNVKNRI